MATGTGYIEINGTQHQCAEPYDVDFHGALDATMAHLGELVRTSDSTAPVTLPVIKDGKRVSLAVIPSRVWSFCHWVEAKPRVLSPIAIPREEPSVMNTQF